MIVFLRAGCRGNSRPAVTLAPVRFPPGSPLHPVGWRASARCIDRPADTGRQDTAPFDEMAHCFRLSVTHSRCPSERGARRRRRSTSSRRRRRPSRRPRRRRSRPCTASGSTSRRPKNGPYPNKSGASPAFIHRLPVRAGRSLLCGRPLPPAFQPPACGPSPGFSFSRQ